MRIVPGDLADLDTLTLLATHLEQCRGETAPGSAHALDVEGLRGADVEFYVGYEGAALIALGALKRLDASHGELKSMHIAQPYRGRGLAAEMLAHLVALARARGLKRLSLETGSWDFFHPARKLYRRHGFRDTTVFAPYKPDPHSRFLTLDLGNAEPVIETRDAEDADLPALLAIYNEIIATSTAIYRDDPTTLEERAAWLADRRRSGFPVIVASSASEALGFASYGHWRGAFPGYRRTVEHSVHLGVGARGRGIGAVLMGRLLDLAREQHLHAMVGAIDADNAASLRFHEKLGFTKAAHFHEVGVKFGRWLDLVFMEKRFEGSPHAPG